MTALNPKSCGFSLRFRSDSEPSGTGGLNCPLGIRFARFGCCCARFAAASPSSGFAALFSLTRAYSPTDSRGVEAFQLAASCADLQRLVCFPSWNWSLKLWLTVAGAGQWWSWRGSWQACSAAPTDFAIKSTNSSYTK